MEIKDIHQSQRREDSERIARLRRVQKVEKAAKVSKIKDSEKDKEEKKNKGQQSAVEVTVKQINQGPTSTTIELTEKASKIADRYEAQNHMMGQHIGNIERLRSSLNNTTEEKAIKEVKQLKAKQAKKAYENSANYKQTSNSQYEGER